MTDAIGAMAPLHNRIPVFLLPREWEAWPCGSFDGQLAFRQRKFPDGLIEMERTPELWVAKKKKASA
jgi:putative SOS response-associated peptidase YedK